jgi:hypothetical protein
MTDDAPAATDYPDLPQPEAKQTQPTMEVHPLADIFPAMQGVDFEALVVSIKQNGLRETIITLDGKILMDAIATWHANAPALSPGVNRSIVKTQPNS